MSSPTTDITDSDRMALAVCPNSCPAPCTHCQAASARHAAVIAQLLRERHGGSSTTADWLDGVGCHPRGGSQP